MRGKSISTIYFYFISAVALILLVVGMYHSFTYIINITQYSKYPLPYTRNCEAEYQTPIIMQDPRSVNVIEPAQSNPQTNQKQIDNRRKECEEQIAFERKKHRLDDLRNMIVFTAAGLLLFATHFPIALRRSNSPL